jgi:uncharacterized membrane protein
MKTKLILLLAVLSISSAFAETYYADVQINVDSSGKVSISGQTNHPVLKLTDSDLFTTKNKEVWLLNISTYGLFSDFIYQVNLPSGASVNYIKSTGTFRIKSNSNSISIIGTGHNEPFEIAVQYTLGTVAFPYEYFAIPLPIAIAVYIIFVLLRKKKKRIEKIVSEVKIQGLTERQKQIVDLLIKNKSMTQKQLQEATNLPKASLSRNIDALVRKGIVIKEEKGMTNAIILKKE